LIWVRSNDGAASVVSVRAGRWLLRAAAWGLTGFILLTLLLQLAPPHYSLVSQAVSDLGVGPFGWLMAVGLSVSGLSILAFVAGTILIARSRPWAGLLCLAIWGCAAFSIGFFPTDIIDAHGYPGTAAAFANSTTSHGRTHLTIAAISFLSMVVGLITATIGFRREPRLKSIWLILLTLAVAVAAGLFLIDPIGVRGYFGLIERAVSTLGFGWVILVARSLGRDRTVWPS